MCRTEFQFRKSPRLSGNIAVPESVWDTSHEMPTCELLLIYRILDSNKCICCTILLKVGQRNEYHRLLVGNLKARSQKCPEMAWSLSCVVTPKLGVGERSETPSFSAAGCHLSSCKFILFLNPSYKYKHPLEYWYNIIAWCCSEATMFWWFKKKVDVFQQGRSNIICYYTSTASYPSFYRSIILRY